MTSMTVDMIKHKCTYCEPGFVSKFVGSTMAVCVCTTECEYHDCTVRMDRRGNASAREWFGMVQFLDRGTM